MTTVIIDPGAEDAEVGLQRLQQLVHHIVTGHRAVAEGVVLRPLGGMVAGIMMMMMMVGVVVRVGQQEFALLLLLLLERQLLMVVVQHGGLVVLAIRAVA